MADQEYGGKGMILSVRRRTDIPAYYSEWFNNRIREDWVTVRAVKNLKEGQIGVFDG